MAEHETQETSSWWTPELRDRIAAALMAMGDPAMAQRFIEGRRREASAAEKAAAARAAGASFGSAQEREAAGDPAGALSHYQAGLRGATDPTLIKFGLEQMGKMVQRGKRVQAYKGLEQYMTERTAKGPMPDNAAAVFALRAAADLEIDPAQLPNLKKFAQETWNKLELGEKTRMISTGDPDRFVDHFKTTLIKLGESALVRTEGGKAVSVEAEIPEVMLQGPEQQAIQKPGVRLPRLESRAPAAPEVGFQPVGGVRPAAAPEPLPVISPAPPKRTPLSESDAVLLKSVGIARTYVQDLSTEEAKTLESLRAGTTAVKPTADQAVYLSKRGIPSGLSWDAIRAKYPNAAQVYLDDVAREDARKATLRVAEQKKELAGMPFVTAFPQAAKVPFNKTTRQRDETITLNDVTAGEGVLLDPESARSVTQLSGVVPSLLRLRDVSAAILAKSPGMNLGQALKLAVQSRLASSEDVAVFEALSGTLGLQIAVAIQGSRPSDTDAQAIRLAFPTTRETVRTGTARLNALVRLLGDSIDARLGKPVGPLLGTSLGRGEAVPGSSTPGGGTFENRALPKPRGR